MIVTGVQLRARPAAASPGRRTGASDGRSAAAAACGTRAAGEARCDEAGGAGEGEEGAQGEERGLLDYVNLGRCNRWSTDGKVPVWYRDMDVRLDSFY